MQVKTYATKRKDIKREQHIIDAAGKTLGRLASQVAGMLMGKHKPLYSPNVDIGDRVIVINAAKVQVTGKKAKDKVYYHHSGFHGGLKSITFEDMMKKDPTLVITHAVHGMLPHTRLGDVMRTRLRVYAGDTYPHQPEKKAEKPELKEKK
jgi:large subunit ribosomal protein L13